jgi:hypothetical protein
LSSQFAASASGRFQFEKRSQLFMGVRDQSFSVAICGHNPNSSPLLEADERERPAMSSMARHKN